jgi:hypothetical protein
MANDDVALFPNDNSNNNKGEDFSLVTITAINQSHSIKDTARNVVDGFQLSGSCN